MSQIEEVNEQVIERILTTDQFWEALWGKETFSPSTTISVPNDYNCGAFCNSLEYVTAFIEQITESDISLLDDPYIDIIVYFFTGIKRFVGESNDTLLNKMKSLLIREDTWRSERLGTPWDIINVLSYYIDRSFIYYIPNHVLTNLLTNGDFEDAISSEWTISPSGDRTTTESFSGSWKLDFSGFTSANQTVSVTAGTYILNSFIDPASTPSGDTDIFNLTIHRDSDSYYFDTSLLTWGASDPSNVFTTDSDDYQLAEFFVIADDSYDITITFEKIVDFNLDHVEFGEKLYPAFEVIYTDIGLADGFASFWVDGTVLPENASFLDQDFMFSSATSVYSDTYFQSLIDTVKAAGVLGVFNRELRI